MIRPIAASLLAGLVLAGASLPATVLAQPTASDPMGPRPSLPAPIAVPFPRPPDVGMREYSLDETVAIALANQPTIQTRLAAYAAAVQRVDQALSPLLPQLSGSLGGRWNHTDLRTKDLRSSLNGVEDLDVSRGAGQLALSQLLFDFGKTWAATDAARASANASKDDVEIQKDLITLAVKESYVNLRFASRLVVVATQALDRADVSLRSARGFFEVGSRPKSDVTRAEVDVANARVGLIRAQNAVALARIALNTAMGISVDSPTRVRDILVYEKFPLDPQTLVADALQRRPEYRQARSRLDAADATVRQTFRAFFPDLVGTGSVTGNRIRTNGDITGLSKVDSGEWLAQLELRWSIFDGGNKIARYKEAQALVDAARASVRDTELTIWQQVEGSWVNLIEAEERIGAAQKAVQSAEENFRLFQGRFDAGVGNIIELTDAQFALTQAQFNEAQALADYRISYARLERALGRR
jgi:outer membrane protein